MKNIIKKLQKNKKNKLTHKEVRVMGNNDSIIKKENFKNKN